MMVHFVSVTALILMVIEMTGFVLLFFNLIPAVFTLSMGGILIILMFAVIIVYNIPIRCPACGSTLEKKAKTCNQHDNYSKLLKNMVKEKKCQSKPHLS